MNLGDTLRYMSPEQLLAGEIVHIAGSSVAVVRRLDGAPLLDVVTRYPRWHAGAPFPAQDIEGAVGAALALAGGRRR